MSEFGKITSLADLAKEVIEVQNACNLSGVVHAFSRAVTVMRTELGMDTPACNTHPITVLYLDKLNQLAGIQPPSTEARDYWGVVMTAFDQCIALQRG